MTLVYQGPEIVESALADNKSMKLGLYWDVFMLI
jgi:hypothetical protein